MRIGLGFILLADLCIRALSLRAHYSDEGVLPIEVLKAYNWNPYYFSFHALSGAVRLQALLFVLHAVCAVCLMIGYRSRLFTFICWAMLVSLHNRNPFVLQGGDELLRLVLFWGIFLPLGKAYAIRPTPYNDPRYFSFANIGYLLLIASVYFFSAMLKTSDEWHSEGSAIYYALSLDQMRLPLGSLIYQYPWLMTLLTHVVYWTEVIAPLLLLFPFKVRYLRLLGILGIFVLHLGIAFSLYVGLFYLIGIITLIGLLPTEAMDRIAKWLPFKQQEATLPEAPARPSAFMEFFRLNISLYCIVLAVYCLILNFSHVSWFGYDLRPDMVQLSHVLRLEQNWGMFSPSVLKDDGWYVYEGYLANGQPIDLRTGKTTTDFSKPASVVATFESDRWRKYSENYTFYNNNHMRPYFCRYLIRNWNQRHPAQRITEATIFYMQETTLPGYLSKPVEKLALCNCRDTTP